MYVKNIIFVCYMATEFDTKISLKVREDFTVPSDKDLDSFCGDLWPVLNSSAREVGQDAGDRFWMEYSTFLVTRYLVVDVTDPEPEKTPHDYRVKISSGTKSGYAADFIIGMLVLAFMWGLSKVFSPGANILFVVLMAVSLVLGAGLAIFITRPFGKNESAGLRDKIYNKQNII